jgi:pyridoxine 4-dehydrogenase
MTDFVHPPASARLGDLEVRRLGFGAMQLPGPGVWGEPSDPERAKKVLRRVVELGINLIDTSWYYGPLVSNRLILEALHPYPRDLVLATKLGGKRTPDKGWAAALRPDELRSGCEEDLRTLKVERVDVVHLRWINGASVPFAESLDAMIELQKEGKIRHIGLSNVTLAQIEEALARTPIVDVENLYNVAAGEKRLGRSPLAITAEQEEIVDLCEARGLLFLPFFSLALPGRKLDNAPLSAIAQRRGKTESQIALAWLLARSKAMLPIPGTSSAAHLDENWDARTIALSPEEFAEIAAARGL